MAAQLGGTGGTITSGIELAPGASADVFGLQVEAQTGPSAYKPTPGRGGVYSAARFSEDVLRARADGLDWHAIRVRITSRREDA